MVKLTISILLTLTEGNLNYIALPKLKPSAWIWSGETKVEEWNRKRQNLSKLPEILRWIFSASLHQFVNIKSKLWDKWVWSSYFPFTFATDELDRLKEAIQWHFKIFCYLLKKYRFIRSLQRSKFQTLPLQTYCKYGRLGIM